LHNRIDALVPILPRRLDAARTALLSREGACVTAIAPEFCFHHFGRFAQSYAARFGETPSETVRKAMH
jgi:transcriptional regulator GlxA family with amidase domain